ncbi:MAG: hypothetical protein IK152_04080 [Lachnospiraceae bacterium]|nr:hypothetical protein [Lachnospiraceae bacterium]
MKKKTNNIGLKILSLIAAVIIWLVVVNIDDPITSRSFSNIPVTIQNEETITSEGKVFSVIDNSDLITVTVKGKRSVIDDLTSSDIQATADMKEIDVSLGLVPIEISSTKNSNKIEEITTRTRNLKISMEDLETKQFAIACVISGNPAEGYAVGDVSITPNVLKVSGPASQVNKVNRVVVRIDVTGMGTKLNLNPAPVLLDSEGNTMTSSRITTNISEVNAEVTMINSKEIPIVINTIGSPADGYTLTKTDISPEKIKVKGDAATLASLTEIKLPDNLLDVSGATQSVEKTIDLEEYLPEGVEPVDEADATVLVSAVIEHLEKKTLTLPASRIKQVNLTMGLQATVTTGKISVDISGLSENIRKMKESDITLEIDLSDYTKPGKYSSVPVKITTPVGIKAADGVKVDILIAQDN